MAQASALAVPPVTSSDRARAIEVQHQAESASTISQVASSAKTNASLLIGDADQGPDRNGSTAAPAGDTTSSFGTQSTGAKAAAKTPVSYASVSKAYADHTVH